MQVVVEVRAGSGVGCFAGLGPRAGGGGDAGPAKFGRYATKLTCRTSSCSVRGTRDV